MAAIIKDRQRPVVPFVLNRLAPVVAGLSLLLLVEFAHGSDLLAYQFDDNMLLGSSSGQLSRFNNPDQFDPGVYNVDLFVNGAFISRQSVEFRRRDLESGPVTVPCLSDRFLVRDARVLPNKLVTTPSSASQEPAGDAQLSSESICKTLGERVPGSAYKFDVAALRLDLSIPQALMDNKPRGSVSTDELDAGSTMAFVNYDSSYYRSRYTGQGGATSNYGYLGLNSGINLGLWRFRQQGTYRYSDYGGETTRSYNAIRTYGQRALPSLRSEMTVGDSYTPGSLFSSLAYRGVQLATDDRMLPDSMQGYAPQVRGTASTNARVIVSQNGHDIYETTVAPGPFVIDDLGGTSYQGDLDVRVVEADGRVSTFTVPFAAVPDSMRPGQSRYSATLGQARYYDDDTQDLFGDATYQRGISNSLTANLGARVGDRYLAFLGGGVLATELGAFGFNTTFSDATAENDERKQGWRAEATYSRTFQPTATTLNLAGYRYSTDGFRDLSDVLGVRHAEKEGTNWMSTTYQQRNQYLLSVNQSLGGLGSLYISGSTADYYDGSSRDTQLQFGYTNTWRDLAYNLSYTRQKSVHYNPNYNNDQLPDYITRDESRNTYDDSVVMLALSLPLTSDSNSPYLSSSISHRSGDSKGETYQSGLSGTLGEARTTSYNLSASRDSEDHTTGWGGMLQQQMPSATVGATYSQGNGYKQGSVSARGAAVVHSGGVTLGPYLSDTFGLVEAKGATGATIRGGRGAKIDGSGYALVPSLTPYRYNPVGLDPQGIDKQAELVETDRQVAPYAGAMVKLQFKTLTGHALLIRALRADGSTLPLGANVRDAKGVNIGMVGQGGQLYARAEGTRGYLLVQWGDAADEKCQLAYDLTGQPSDQALVRLQATCTPVTS
ncbi:fimbria/pilus outer membrane usher protein [Pseudomonas sp. 30_B]|uniref:fimbria/pilus outer membrane usher protein n=1 Tax=Pseudomonas sp. 30_B TaxID=2813575 RepID=UPI001A9EEC7E|nr:fimbria/pilus outer membrane usher protein [Pseudomonas sp. 30_B]